MIDEIRIDNLGVIGRAYLELGPGPDGHHGGDRRGQDDGADGDRPAARRQGRLGDRADRRPVGGGRGARDAGARVRGATRAAEAGAELDDDGSLVLVRTVGAGAAGRSRAFLGGRSVPRPSSPSSPMRLVTVHGQADQARLRSPSHQREALDAFVGSDHRDALTRYRTAWTERARVEAELVELVERARDRTREAELLRLGLAEVERVAPQAGEDVALAEEVGAARARGGPARGGERCPHVARRRRGRRRERRRRDDRPGPTPARARRCPRSRAGRARHRIAEAGYLLADAATDLAGYLEDLQADPLRLDAAQRRRVRPRLVDADVRVDRRRGARVGRLRRATAARPRRRGPADRVAAGRAGGAGRGARVPVRAHLGAAAREGATSLASVVSEELSGLAMGSAELQIVVEPLDEPGPHGGDRVEMLLVPHAGAPARPLGKGASGGELSRVMLAIEVALATAPDSGRRDPARSSSTRSTPGWAGGLRSRSVGGWPARAGYAGARRDPPRAGGGVRGPAPRGDQVDGGRGRRRHRVGRAFGHERRPRTELARMLSGQEDSDAARTHAAELLELSSVGR